MTERAPDNSNTIRRGSIPAGGSSALGGITVDISPLPPLPRLDIPHLDDEHFGGGRNLTGKNGLVATLNQQRDYMANALYEYMQAVDQRMQDVIHKLWNELGGQ